MLSKCLLFILLTALCCAGCQSKSDDQTPQNRRWNTGVLPTETPQLLEAEWKIFRQQHPDLEENAAKREFDIIQHMSRAKYDEDIAKWTDRKLLANAWLKKNIEEVYNADSIDDELIQAAIDAYAFKSGYPDLVTVSHILIKADELSTPDERVQALQAIRKTLIDNRDFSNEALKVQAQRLERAGFRVDMNADLTFPRSAIPSFMGESLPYQTTVEPFADASFKLSEDNPLSDIVESAFGLHLILFRNFAKGKKASLEKDRDFIINNIVKRGRKFAATQRIDELMNSEIRINEARVSQMTSPKKSNDSN